jgi:hypothetical protein
VAFGQADLYYLSGRQPAVPNQLYYWTALYNDEEWANAVEAVERRKPALIVWVQAPPPNRMSSERFEQMILEGYEPDRSFGSIRLFRRKPD